MRIGVISLGCDKNRVDAEKMLARLCADGHVVVSDPDLADVLIVNTCAFIDSAKQESIDEICALAARKERTGQKIIVTGCLAKRYPEQLKEEFPEVDAFLGVADYDNISKAVEAVFGGEKYFRVEGGDKFYRDRMLTTPPHTAYLKIADGCNNRCTYCAIPSIRGAYRSEPIMNLAQEAERLCDDGVKELILVAQDVSRYGMDIYGVPSLIQLVQELEKLDFEWIRLLYLEPEMVTDELLDFVANEPKVVKYMDVPLQHVDSEVLRRMNRHTNEEMTYALARRVHSRGITLRSTFICGFPGESERAYGKLKDFIAGDYVDFAGFFPYSREEGTPADRMSGHLPKRVREARAKELSSLWREGAKRRAKTYIGRRFDVLYEDIDYEREMFAGRAYWQAPDIDSMVYFTSDKPLDVGNFYTVEVVGTDGIDLIAKTV